MREHPNVFCCVGKLCFEKTEKQNKTSERCLESKAVFVLEDALSVCVRLVVCLIKDGCKTQGSTGQEPNGLLTEIIILRFAPS